VADQSSHDPTIATTVAAIVPITNQPTICSGRGGAKRAMIAWHVVRCIVMIMTGMTAMPFSTAHPREADVPGQHLSQW
jgi:hypothetical protein